MAPTLGCVISNKLNPDSSYTLQIVTPDQTTQTVWSETNIALGHYFCGTANKHGRYSALPIPADEEQRIALAHRALSQACQHLITLNKDLEYARANCERQIAVCRKRKEGACNETIASAIIGSGIAVAGLVTLQPWMVGGGLLALSRCGSSDAEASAHVAEEQRQLDILDRKEQQLASARQAVRAAAAAYTAAFHIPIQRLKLVRSYKAR